MNTPEQTSPNVLSPFHPRCRIYSPAKLCQSLWELTQRGETTKADELSTAIENATGMRLRIVQTKPM